MRYALVVTPSAKRQIAKLSPPVKARITAKIDSLAENPRPPDMKKLVGDVAYRVRVGDWRIIYEIRDAEVVVLVLRVGHRREIYR
jgi:mRNA interferase RelE/StbE